jgi:uncharacterized membrane protein
MTKNLKQITELRKEQKKKKKQIETSKKKMFRNLLWIGIVLFGLSMLYLEYGYKGFTSPKSFLTSAIFVSTLIVVSYYGITRNQNRQKEKEIKIIRGKLYRLMKLDDD